MHNSFLFAMRYSTSFCGNTCFLSTQCTTNRTSHGYRDDVTEYNGACVARIGSASGAFNLLFDKILASSSNIIIYHRKIWCIVFEQRASSANNLLWSRWTKKKKKTLGQKHKQTCIRSKCICRCVFVPVVKLIKSFLFIHAFTFPASSKFSAPIFRMQDSFGKI